MATHPRLDRRRRDVRILHEALGQERTGSGELYASDGFDGERPLEGSRVGVGKFVDAVLAERGYRMQAPSE